MMMPLRRGAQLAAKSAAAVVDLVNPAPIGVVILAYHRIGGGTELELDLEPSIFNEQMAYIDDLGRIKTLGRGLEDLVENEGPKSVVVTFDDGTADFMDHALPALVANGIPATYYIATRFIEEQLPFPDDGRPLSWSALAEAVSTGLIDVGSHTHSHAVADKLSPRSMDVEIRRAAELIEDNLGVPARDFAYPKGVFGGAANAARIARVHRSAAVADCGVNPYGMTDPYRLDRTPIQRSDGMSFFRRKVEGGQRFEGTLRSVLNRRRYMSRSS